MTRRLLESALAIALAAVAAPSCFGAENYTLDAAHAAVTFKASHLGLSWTYGRFKEISGAFAIDTADPTATRFEVVAKAESLDTDNAKRDEHLRGPDFFNSKEFPVVSFKSTSVKAVEGGYEVTGDLTLHGVTKPIAVVLRGGGTAEFPKGVHRTGYSGEFQIKRSEFGMDKMTGPIGDEVFVAISFEGTR
ncbi:YceI family protein [Aquisphaera insulae]|uniref:YceI family protein n=1 Tax=Aquisphaera insulae TaxID=2712864 RepID=UPI0013EABBD0|nr:YceI family protein [Aquisphaera insulae]